MAFGIPGINAVVPPNYKLFISHAWDHAQYDALVELIKPDVKFRWENLSVPKQSPIAMLVGLPKSARTLVREIDERIRQAHCVVIITGMFVAHSQWIQSEIEAALEFKKPIVGVAPRGQERIPEAARLAIEQANGEHVRWNRESIISAIRRGSGLEPRTIIHTDFVRLSTPPPTLPASLWDLVSRPTQPPPPSPSPEIAKLINDMTKNWPRK